MQELVHYEETNYSKPPRTPGTPYETPSAVKRRRNSFRGSESDATLSSSYKRSEVVDTCSDSATNVDQSELVDDCIGSSITEDFELRSDDEL